MYFFWVACGMRSKFVVIVVFILVCCWVRFFRGSRRLGWVILFFCLMRWIRCLWIFVVICFWCCSKCLIWSRIIFLMIIIWIWIMIFFGLCLFVWLMCCIRFCGCFRIGWRLFSFWGILSWRSFRLFGIFLFLRCASRMV